MSGGDEAAGAIERRSAERIAAAGIRLRFDRVACRVIAALQAGVGPALPQDSCLIVTLTAPIRRPGRTSAALEPLLRDLADGDGAWRLEENAVRARLIRLSMPGGPALIGFVHNVEADAGHILDLAEACLRHGGPPGRRAAPSV